KSWTQTPTSITFTLRKDATCADGTSVTPSVVAKSLMRVAKQSPQAARLWGKGPYTLTPDDSAGTINLTVRTPYGALLYGFYNYASAVVCPAGLVDPKLLETTPAGSGPFSIVSAVHGDSVTFKARPEWKWGPLNTSASGPGFPSTLVYKIVANDTTAA